VTAGNASRRVSNPFQVSIRATEPMSNAPSSMPTRARKEPARSGRNGVVQDHDHIGRVELAGHCGRDGDDTGGEPAGQEPFDAQGGAGLEDDLTGVPDMGAPGEGGGGPAVPGVERVAVKHTCIQAPGQPGQP
jgi:hypothetical protein